MGLQRVEHDWAYTYIEKWSISYHVNKQGCQSHKRFWTSKCEFLSLEGTQEGEQYLLFGSHSDQIRSVARSCPTLCYPMNCRMPGLPVHQAAAVPYGENWDLGRMWKTQDTDPRWLRCIWKEWFQWAQTLASSHTQEGTGFLHLRLVFCNSQKSFWCSDYLPFVANSYTT